MTGTNTQSSDLSATIRVVPTTEPDTESPDTGAKGPSEGPVRRVLTETEVPEPCDRHFEDPCEYCDGSRIIWRVTSRTVQVATPYDEQAAYSYIRTLHAHIRKAAATVDQAARFLEQAGQSKQAAGMRAAAKAVLEPTVGQD